MTFEEKQAKLEEIINKLSNQDSLSLKETSNLYKEGKKLISELYKELEQLKSEVSDTIVEN